MTTIQELGNGQVRLIDPYSKETLFVGSRGKAKRIARTIEHAQGKDLMRHNSRVDSWRLGKFMSKACKSFEYKPIDTPKLKMTDELRAIFRNLI